MDTHDSTTSKQCAVCGLWFPATNEWFHVCKNRSDGLHNTCKECAKARARKWYHSNTERGKQTRRAWAEANREQIAAYKREWKRANRERLAENAKVWYQANKEAIRVRRRKWYIANAEHARAYTRQWAIANPDQYKANRLISHHRRRARIAGNGGEHTAAELDAIRAAQTDKQGRLICWLCNNPINDKPQLDHFIPLARGGTDNAGNLHYTHAKCNQSKGAKLPHEIGRLL